MAKEMVIEKNVSINKNINEVFSFLKQTKNQDQFSVWNMKDPGMKKVIQDLMEPKDSFTHGIVKTKMLVQVRRKLLTYMREAELTTN